MNTAEQLASLWTSVQQKALQAEVRPMRGRVLQIRGVMISALLPRASIGELCYLRDPLTGRMLEAEVTGVENEYAVLMPVGDMNGLSTRAEVIPSGRPLSIPAGDYLLGRVIDGLGRLCDMGPDISGPSERRPVQQPATAALQRQVISEPFRLGVRVLDGLLTMARGQRMAILGEPGAGKSSLLAQIIRACEADVVVVALIGERGREVREFIEHTLTEEMRSRTVMVVATSDRPAMERVKAAYTATAVAEYFRDQGRNVLLLQDSITRFARAQREIGLASGEPPARRGYPPSFFAELPKLLERSGPGRNGMITALYTVLTEGDSRLDPVAEETVSLLDGHIRLSSELAAAEHFPAVDVLNSRSRLMKTVASASHYQSAGRIRDILARYQKLELLLQVGEYQPGQSEEDDFAVNRIAAVNRFLKQDEQHSERMPDTLAAMEELIL